MEGERDRAQDCERGRKRRELREKVREDSKR